MKCNNQSKIQISPKILDDLQQFSPILLWFSPIYPLTNLPCLVKFLWEVGWPFLKVIFQRYFWPAFASIQMGINYSRRARRPAVLLWNKHRERRGEWWGPAAWRRRWGASHRLQYQRPPPPPAPRASGRQVAVRLRGSGAAHCRPGLRVLLIIHHFSPISSPSPTQQRISTKPIIFKGIFYSGERKGRLYASLHFRIG